MKNRLAAALFFCSFVAYGQGSLPAKPVLDKGFIAVTGTASKEVVPDRIFVAITLKQQPTDKQAYAIQKQEEALKKVILSNGIDLKLLSLADAGSELISYKKRDVGYEVSKEFILQLTTAGQVAKVAQELQAANIREISIARVAYSQLEDLQKEVRIAALKAAKNKAEYLLQAIGEQLDKPLSIEEVKEPYFGRPSVSNSILANSTSASAEDSTEVGFSKIQVKFSYSVKYGIK